MRNFLLSISLSLFTILNILWGCTQPSTENSTTGDQQTTTDPPPTCYVTLSENYIEKYSDYGPLESWLYDSSNNLVEYAVYFYDATNDNTEVRAYSRDDLTDDSTYLGKFLYAYDNQHNITKGEVFDKNNLRIQNYDATYNAQGNYLTFLLKDQTDDVIENRTCTYDGTGYYYDTESYYLGAGTSNKIEEYKCFYDGSWNYIKETHYLKIVSDPGDPSDDIMTQKTISHNFVYTYSWDINGNMYAEADFDESGDCTTAILYVHENNVKKSRSYLVKGKLQTYRTYSYDLDDNLAEECHYNMNIGDKLEKRYVYQYYQKEGANYYARTIYNYSYPLLELSVFYRSRGRVNQSEDINAALIRKFKIPASPHKKT